MTKHIFYCCECDKYFDTQTEKCAHMNTEELKAKLRDLLEKSPAPDPLPDDFNAYDYSGGNYDDAYDFGNRRGYKDGRHDALQEVINLIQSSELP